MIYLTITGAWNEFISYAIKGISTFSNSIPYKSLFEQDEFYIVILAKILPVAVPIIIITTIISLIKKEKNDIQILTIYSLPMLITIYPISDKIHFLIGSLMIFIEFTYLNFILLKFVFNKITFSKKIFIYKTITILILQVLVIYISTIAICSGMYYIQRLKNKELNTTIQHYNHIEISNDLKERIDQISKFTNKMEAQGKKVYIIDAEAAVYNIPLNKYIKNYDMFLKGNIGKDGEDGIIEKINSERNDVVYLVKQKQYRLNWQTPTKVIGYIRNNMQEIEDVSIFTAYKK